MCQIWADYERNSISNFDSRRRKRLGKYLLVVFSFRFLFSSILMTSILLCPTKRDAGDQRMKLPKLFILSVSKRKSVTCNRKFSSTVENTWTDPNIWRRHAGWKPCRTQNQDRIQWKQNRLRFNVYSISFWISADSLVQTFWKSLTEIPPQEWTC